MSATLATSGRSSRLNMVDVRHAGSPSAFVEADDGHTVPCAALRLIGPDGGLDPAELDLMDGSRRLLGGRLLLGGRVASSPALRLSVAALSTSRSLRLNLRRM